MMNISGWLPSKKGRPRPCYEAFRSSPHDGGAFENEPLAGPGGKVTSDAPRLLIGPAAGDVASPRARPVPLPSLCPPLGERRAWAAGGQTGAQKPDHTGYHQLPYCFQQARIWTVASAQWQSLPRHVPLVNGRGPWPDDTFS